MEKFTELISINDEILKSILDKYGSFDEIIKNNRNIILEYQSLLDRDKYYIDGDIWISKNSKIEDSALIKGPSIIMDGVELRHNAFIRGDVFVMPNCVVGNSTELKNCIIFPNSQVPHFNYVGDSILGNHSHLGAGAIISNVKSDNSNIKYQYKDEIIETDMRKLGAVLGDNVEVGCNSVLCPGTVIDRNTNIYPLTRVRGYIGPNKIVKSPDNIVDKNNDKALVRVRKLENNDNMVEKK